MTVAARGRIGLGCRLTVARSEIEFYLNAMQKPSAGGDLERITIIYIINGVSRKKYSLNIFIVFVSLYARIAS